MNNNSIKKPLIAAICGAIFLAFIAFLMIVRHVIVDDYMHDIEINDKKFAEVLSVNIDHILERYFDFGMMIAEYPGFLNSSPDFQRNFLANAVKKEPSYEFLTIVDTSGKVQNYSEQKFIDVNKNIYEWFKVMRPKYEPEISPAYFSEKTQKLVMTFVHGIEENGEVKAAILGDIELNVLREMIREFNENNSCRAYLIDKNGAAIAQPDDEGKIYSYRFMHYSTVAKNFDGYAEFDKNGHIKLREASFEAPKGLISAVRAAMKGESGVSEYSDANNYRYFCCYQPIDLPLVKTRWSLVIVHQTNDMLSGMDRIIYRAMFGGVIIVTLIAFAMAKFAEKITAPILKMAAMANRVRAGDLSGQLDIKADNEIGELAENINHMIRALRATQEKSKQSEQQLKVTAYYDGLTGLPNRNYFLIRLRKMIGKSIHGRFYGALLFVDVDKFKSVNDTYGHAVGDGLLIEFGKRIVEIVGNKEYACRYGGDEFILFLLGYNEADTESICHSLVNKMRKPFNISGNEFKLSASVGVAFMPKDANDIDDLMEKADSALYISKRNGRDQFNFYQEGMVNESKNIGNDF